MRLSSPLRLAALAGMFPLAGCLALKPVELKSVKVSYDPKDILIQYDRAERPSIRVAAFQDNRPEIERVGRSPKAWRLLVYNWRRGTFVTGDDVWMAQGGASPVAAAVGGSMRECLASTEFFDKVAFAAAEKGAAKDEKYALRGTIESFYAEQKYRGSAYFLGFMYGDSESFWAPKARCRLSYELVEAKTGRVIRKGQAEARALGSDGGDISQAGLKALRLAQTRLANDVTRALKSEAAAEIAARAERPAPTLAVAESAR